MRGRKLWMFRTWLGITCEQFADFDMTCRLFLTGALHQEHEREFYQWLKSQR